MGLFAQLDIELHNHDVDVDRFILSDRNPECPHGFEVLDDLPYGNCPTCGHVLVPVWFMAAGSENVSREVIAGEPSWYGDWFYDGQRWEDFGPPYLYTE